MLGMCCVAHLLSVLVRLAVLIVGPQHSLSILIAIAISVITVVVILITTVVVAIKLVTVVSHTAGVRISGYALHPTLSRTGPDNYMVVVVNHARHNGKFRLWGRFRSVNA